MLSLSCGKLFCDDSYCWVNSNYTIFLLLTFNLLFNIVNVTAIVRLRVFLTVKTNITIFFRLQCFCDFIFNQIKCVNHMYFLSRTIRWFCWSVCCVCIMLYFNVLSIAMPAHTCRTLNTGSTANENRRDCQIKNKFYFEIQNPLKKNENLR